MASAGTETALSRSPRRPTPPPNRSARRLRFGKVSGPYLLILPSVLIIAAVLAYPIYTLVRLSMQVFNIRQLLHNHDASLGAPPRNIGLKNFRTIFGDHQFWAVLWRTFVFTVVNVGSTLAIGLLLALLLLRVSKPVRIALQVSLIFIWALPQLVAITIWSWLFDSEFGAINYLLTRAHLGHFVKHEWFSNPLTGFMVVTIVVVWGAVPFVAITLHAVLTQVPDELVEAARIDGANVVQVFRRITMPILRPILIILASLSVIWDFQVFSQIWILTDYRPDPSYYTIAIYAYHLSFTNHDYGLGAAISIVTVVMLLAVSVFYIRQMIRIGEVQ